MDFTVSYTPDPKTGLLRDPAFAELMNACGFTSKPRMAKVRYFTTNTVKHFSNIGYKPKLEGNLFIQCPLFDSQMDALKSANYSDPLQALKEIFGESSVTIPSIEA
jgi:hypothetical protein